MKFSISNMRNVKRQASRDEFLHFFSSRFPLPASRSSAGFTLIELLIVIGVFGLVGVIILTTLVNILHSTNKTTVINTVRQNGDYALAQMTKTIRTAVSLQTPSLPCNTPSTPTTSSTLTVADANGVLSSFVCTGANTITLNGSSLLDTNTTSVTSCTFTCSQQSIAGTPVIGIDFSVKDNSSSGFYEQNISPIEFKTTIIMQNVGQ